MVFLAYKTPDPMQDLKPTRMRSLRYQGKSSYLLKKIDEDGKFEELDKKPRSLVRSKKKWRTNTD